MSKQKEKQFSLDTLHDLLDKHGKLTIEILCEEFDFFTRRRITQKLNNKKRAGELTYGDNFSNIKLLKPLLRVRTL
ncbi:hypothetical protein HO406_07935 [Streptococcus suis]|nr:hypothetical protein [Streptococcus suis]